MAAKSYDTGEACADEVARVAVGKRVQAAVEECKTCCHDNLRKKGANTRP